MVQYVITPWRDISELLATRKTLYSPIHPDTTTLRRNAVALVSVWVRRGNCPHSVESTALLVSANLNDVATNSTYAVRAAYSAAFSRFVTGLLDGYQDKKYKMSMYAIAKRLGLPATFVELRHQCTHEELPALEMLRGAARKALQWIWDHYWKNLDIRAARVLGSPPESLQECRDAVWRYLNLEVERTAVVSGRRDEEKELSQLKDTLKVWDRDVVARVILEESNTETMTPQAILRSIRLSRTLFEDDSTDSPREEPEVVIRSLDILRADLESARRDLDDAGDKKQPSSVTNATDDPQEENLGVRHLDEESEEELEFGWRRWEGNWSEKPIGVV